MRNTLNPWVVSLVGASAALAGLLSGCSGSSASAHPESAAVAAASRAGTATAPSGAQPALRASTTATSAKGATAGAGKGCAANKVAIPRGAVTAKTDDVGLDGKADTQFYYSGSSGLAYGIHTASGATFLLKDDLAGGGDRRGWSAVFESHPPMTVLDDGHVATLHAFVNCRFVTTKDTHGKPYIFNVSGGKYGTGVECEGGNTRGGRSLYGVLASRQPNGRYKIFTTGIAVSQDGRTARNSTKRTGPGTYAATSSQVKLANRSTCESLPVVSLSGR